MAKEKRSREELVKTIIEIELDMFERVRSFEPSLCQERPEAFRMMRGITHSVLSPETLESYLADLHEAKAKDRNLITEKYARMDNRIPPLNTNPLIDDIVQIEERWARELSEKYPRTFRGGLGFKVYLSCELETYSDKTLQLYFEDIAKAEKENINLSEVRYTVLFQQLGYDSIAKAEKKAKA